MNPLLEKQYHGPLNLYEKAEARFGLKDNCDISMFYQNYYQQVYSNDEDQFIDIEEAIGIFQEFEDVNKYWLETIFEKDRFFNEGKIGKIRLSKFLMFALLYCRSLSDKEKLLKLSIIFEKVRCQSEIKWFQDEFIQYLENLFYIPIYFMTRVLKQYEKIKNIDEQKSFQTIYKHCTSNKKIIHEFVMVIAEQYFFPKGYKKKSINFKEFIDIAKVNAYWFIKPHMIREEFLVYAFMNPEKALTIQKDDRILGTSKGILSKDSDILAYYDSSQRKSSTLLPMKSKIFKQTPKPQAPGNNQQLTIQNLKSESLKGSINSDSSIDGNVSIKPALKIQELEPPTKDKILIPNSRSPSNNELFDNLEIGDSVSSDDDEDRFLKINRKKLRKTKTQLLLSEREIYGIVIQRLRQKFGSAQIEFFLLFAKSHIEEDDQNRIIKLLYNIRVHQQYTTGVEESADQLIRDLQQILIQNLTMPDILQLYKGKLYKRKFIFCYWELLNKMQDLTNSHFFQLKKLSDQHECIELLQSHVLPVRIQFLQSVYTVRDWRYNKHNTSYVYFTVYLLHQMVMVGISPLKKTVFAYSAVDFEQAENLDKLKKTIIDCLEDRVIKAQLENNGYAFKSTLIPSTNEFDVLMYMCHISYALVFGKEFQLDEIEINTIKQRILYQFAIIFTS